jgi:hypothetical protein
MAKLWEVWKLARKYLREVRWRIAEEAGGALQIEDLV